ncbi:single-stranded DNA-binding protein, partial [Nocardiopsis gilva]
MNETVVTVVGRLVRDPEVRFLEDGTALCRFTVVTTPRVFDRTTGEWGDGDPVFLSCSAWRMYAENIATSVSRGTRVVVVGELRQRTYTSTDGRARTIVDLRVHDLAPTLRWTIARVTRHGWADAVRSGARPETKGEEGE